MDKQTETEPENNKSNQKTTKFAGGYQIYIL